MTIMKILRPQGRRLSLIAVCLLSVWPPVAGLPDLLYQLDC